MSANRVRSWLSNIVFHSQPPDKPKRGSTSANTSASVNEKKGDSNKQNQKGKGKDQSEKQQSATGDGGGGKIDKEQNATTTPSQPGDAQLLSLKAEQKSWMDIATAMGLEPKDIGTLKNRFKELQAGGGGDGAGTSGGAAAATTTATAAPTTTAAAAATGGASTWGEGKWMGKGKGKGGLANETKPDASANNVTKPNGRKIKVLDEDGLFTMDELEHLWKLLMKDEQRRWLRIASRFFDETGVRLHPDDIRETFADE